MTNVYPAETVSGVVTSFIPLTTVFTPTSSCAGQYRLNGPSLVAFDPGYGLDIDEDVVCAPSAVTTWWEQGRFGHGSDADHTAVSIGPLTCPDKWPTVASSIKDLSSTQLMCCPSGYYLENGIEGSVAGDCRSDVSSGMTLTFASTAGTQTESWRIATVALTKSSAIGAIAIVGWNIQVEISSSSTLSRSLGTSSATSSPTKIQQSITSSHSTSSPVSDTTQAATESSRSSGITTGTAVGIGVGVGLGVIGMAALLVTTCLLRRRKRKAGTANTCAAQIKHDPPTIPYGPSQNTAHELQSGDIMLELPADYRQRGPIELFG